MSLYIEWQKPGNDIYKAEWHVGEQVPTELYQKTVRVVKFQADGDELDMILYAMDKKL